ncbi:MAG: 16S rRNA (guanine(527)-N(7))-methyltransferase RsmG [Candidatus Sedimenticola sp. (ex Thyasira tokunagai)]
MSEHEKLWQGQLTAGLKAMGIELSEEQHQKLLNYLALLVKWNRAFNLTAIRDPKEMVSRQLLDALSILHLVKGLRVLDVGTGPGLPGIPLAIALPDVWFTLLDSNGKKTRFVQQSIGTLGLRNIEVIQARVEAFQPQQGYDTITSRAFASLPKMVQLTSHLLADGGQYLAMKGIDPVDELDQLGLEEMKVERITLFVPETTGERHAVVIS